ncbi:hypothetical protein CCR75_004125 [Bremia lactucae]|uniref:Mnd1 HTH domain-containing protein n=1 Tax=Bremia lactucae TaxID=4779 RepID=A0A976ID55_BRELC|nr:hypothetical protein CCR75_004125 [Bremia lactucae]
MRSPLLLVLAPVGLLLGVPLGVLKEKLQKHSLKRRCLALAPFALVSMLSLQSACILTGSYLIGREIGASLVGVGLTGGISTGKSTVSKALQEAGAVIIDADLIARQVVVPGRGAYKEIVRYFGSQVLNEENASINRAKLGAIVFNDPMQRKKLNMLTHKYIIWEMFKQLVYQRLVCRKRLVVLDAPLLFETKLLEYFCYPTIVVACSTKNELSRLMQRDKMTQKDAEKRIQSQMNLQDKVAKADFVIHNDDSMNNLLLRTRETLMLVASLVGKSHELQIRERILRIYHDSKEVYSLKEVEKLGSKAGVVLQTVKDVNQALVDDALVDCDKIGSGNYFWSFPSKLSQSRKRKLSELQQRRQVAQEELAQIRQKIQAQQQLRSESEVRVGKLQRLKELKTKIESLHNKAQHLAENDPAILKELEHKVRLSKEGADRWTDNVYTLKSWVVQKRGVEGKEVVGTPATFREKRIVDKWLGIKDDFDYIA